MRPNNYKGQKEKNGRAQDCESPHNCNSTLGVLQLQIESADEESCHLPARGRQVRAVVSAAASLGDCQFRHPFDEVIENVFRRHIVKTLARRCRWIELAARPQDERSHLLTWNNNIRTKVPVPAANRHAVRRPFFYFQIKKMILRNVVEQGSLIKSENLIRGEQVTDAIGAGIVSINCDRKRSRSSSLSRPVNVKPRRVIEDCPLTIWI